jgi:hypothetical protein
MRISGYGMDISVDEVLLRALDDGCLCTDLPHPQMRGLRDHAFFQSRYVHVVTVVHRTSDWIRMICLLTPIRPTPSHAQPIHHSSDCRNYDE